MKPNCPTTAAATDAPLVPPILATWLSVFRPCFTAPVWNRILVLVAGAVLAPGRRTVTQALRVMGLAEEPQFRRYHDVLARARWDARAVARRLLLYLLERLLPTGEVVIGIDDTIERRWGARIKARGIYRDPVRSSKGHFVKTSGLRWLSLMVVVPIRWSGRRWALPFLSVLAPSARWSETRGKRHKALTDWARQAILQTRRWLPHRRLVFVGDSGFAALELLAAVHRHVCLITRLRLDANLFKPAPSRRRGQRGRPPLTGRRLPKLSAVLASRQTVWTPIVVLQWYNEPQRKLLTATGTAVWYHAGKPPAPIRWVLVRDPTGEHEPSAFLSTDLDATPAMILGWFVLRWRVETTFQEVRTHPGVETQRQWSDLAILRTTPALLGLFSLITVWADGLARDTPKVLRANTAAWYSKQEPTFSDAIAAVRRVLWSPPDLSISRQAGETVTITTGLLNRLFQTLCMAA
jgi:DDE superfamily endonuclease